MIDKTRASLSEGGREADPLRTAGSPTDAPPISTKSRRFSTPLAVLAAGGLVAVAVVGGLLWVRYTRSPQYSLGQMAAAAQSRDWDGVQKYIDVDAVASHFVDTAFSSAGGVGDVSDGGTTMGGGKGRSAGSGASSGSTMKDAFVQRFVDAMKDGVEGTATTGAGDAPRLLVALKPTSVTYVGETEALVTAEMPAEAGGTQDIKLRMKRVDGHWRISALEDVTDLLGLLD